MWLIIINIRTWKYLNIYSQRTHAARDFIFFGTLYLAYVLVLSEIVFYFCLPFVLWSQFVKLRIVKENACHYVRTILVMSRNESGEIRTLDPTNSPTPTSPKTSTSSNPNWFARKWGGKMGRQMNFPTLIQPRDRRINHKSNIPKQHPGWCLLLLSCRFDLGVALNRYSSTKLSYFLVTWHCDFAWSMWCNRVWLETSNGSKDQRNTRQCFTPCEHDKRLPFKLNMILSNNNKRRGKQTLWLRLWAISNDDTLDG